MNKVMLSSGDYNVEGENACASLLAQFNSNYIYDLCTYALSVKDSPSIVRPPNIVQSSEITFNELKQMYPSDVANINEVRDQTYIEIIRLLCNSYQLDFIDQGEQTHFPLAHFLYYFLACGYSNCLTQFFTNYIYHNRNDIYDQLNIGDYKKNKDSSTLYNRKVYKKDIKLGLIIANMDTVIKNMTTMDITLADILKYVMQDQNINNLVLASVQEKREFFKFYKDTLYGQFYPIILANIQRSLKQLYDATV